MSHRTVIRIESGNPFELIVMPMLGRPTAQGGSQGSKEIKGNKIITGALSILASMDTLETFLCDLIL